MKKSLFILFSAATLISTGCAELSAIREAAVNEMRAEVIGEETAIYRGKRGEAAVMTAEIVTPERRKGHSLLEIAMLGEKGSHRAKKGLWER